MGRLNYTNRKTEGLKLGQSIAKDLIKRIPPGTASKSALRDPVVELDVTGKNLGPDGFQEVADALTRSLEYHGETGRVVQLEELCLKANRLSTACLPPLARIIRLAAHELRDLDISDNTFTITTVHHADAWEDFLDSFAECCVLRRIDLSGNPLGSKVFEILARTYSRESAIEPLLYGDLGDPLLGPMQNRRVTLGEDESLEQQTRNLSLASASDTYSDDDDEGHITAEEGKVGSGVGHDRKSPGKDQRQNSLPQLAAEYASIRGLRSVPYLVFANTEMTDEGALHLSYVLACHHPPDRLLEHVPPPRPGHQVQLLDAYDNETGCQGLIYLPNDQVSSPAHRMLELSENARQHLLDDERPAQSPDYSEIHFKRSPSIRKTSITQSSPSTSISGSRRRSGTKGEQQELTSSEALHVELDRARSRIQGNILKDTGVQSNNLWRTALRMLGICRILCPPKPPPVEEVPIPKAKEAQLSPAPPVQDHTQTANDAAFPALPKARTKPFVGYLDPWAPPLASKSANIPVTPQPRKQVLKVKTTTPSPLPTTSPTTVSPKTGAVPVQSSRSELPCGLPKRAWACIMGEYLGANEFMSRKQQHRVLQWALDRRTLAKEMESLGKPESAQIWKVLEGMGCLAYEGDI
ncbi:MAG: hypothetical protein L6R36_007796 [Xanthoria steineri]|nr:MAG: hypothetical protein L6R36_007796 [Xanthoria steineri]